VNTPAEIEQLFSDYYEALHRYAFTILKNSDEAKDVVQSVFLNLWEKRELLNINTSPKAYLFRSVYNESINYIKKQEVLLKHHNAAAKENGREMTMPFPDDDLDLLKSKLSKILLQLPPQCREVFVKSKAEQKKYAEIATELGISVKTVEAHMTKAFKLIRQTLRVFALLACLYTDFT
jgi:RNA polymerase sigma-70 factor (ECF subfamily)